MVLGDFSMGWLQEVADLGVGGEQTLDLAADLRVLALGIKVRGPGLGRRPLEGGVEDRYDGGKVGHVRSPRKGLRETTRRIPRKPITGSFDYLAAAASSPRSSAYRQVRAYLQYRSAVGSEIPSVLAVSAIVNPAKNRSLTTSARSGRTAASRVKASSSARRSSSGGSTREQPYSRSMRCFAPPWRARRFRRTCSTRIRRIASAAAEKKSRRFSQPPAPSPTSRR